MFIDFDLEKHALVSPPIHPLTPALIDLILINHGVMKYLFTFYSNMYSYLFDSTKTQHPATHLDIHDF